MGAEGEGTIQVNITPDGKFTVHAVSTWDLPCNGGGFSGLSRLQLPSRIDLD